MPELEFYIKVFHRDNTQDVIASFRNVDDARTFAFSYPTFLYQRLVIVDDLGQFNLEIINY